MIYEWYINCKPEKNMKKYYILHMTVDDTSPQHKKDFCN